MRDYSKKTRRLIRELAAEAYERQLRATLAALDESFTAWRNGVIGSGELSHRIHQHETGPSRELYKQYNYGDADMNVAYAVASGILTRDDVPQEVLEAIEDQIAFFTQMKERGELKEPQAVAAKYEGVSL